ncbi:MAG: hypothetical protein V1892_00705 [bacterium]
MQEEYYRKVTQRFKVYDKHQVLITDQLYVNKIFETFSSQAAANMALAFAKKIAAKKYGQGLTVNPIGNPKIVKSHKPRPKKSKKGKTKQLELNFAGSQ